MTANRIISVGKYGGLGVEIEGCVEWAVEGVVRVGIRMVPVGRVQEVADEVVCVHEVVRRVAPVFGGEAADGVVGVRGDAIGSVCFLNKTAEGIIGVVARRVFLVRLGRDQAHVVVRVQGRVPDRIGQREEAARGAISC